MDGGEFRAGRTKLGLNQAEMAEQMKVARATVNRWEAGSSPIPPVAASLLAVLLARAAGAEPAKAEPVQAEPAPDDWRAMTDAQRKALPLGAPGWRYSPGEWLPKGQWIETYDEPLVLPHGSIITAIRWGSNGVGMPTMNLIGSTAASCGVDRPGFTSLAPGVHQRMIPNDGARSMAKREAKR